MEGPNALVYVALAVFIPASAVAVAVLGSRGVVGALLGGMMFLPQFEVIGRDVPLLHTKPMFVSAIVLGWSVLLRFRDWRRLRPSLLDVPAAALCAVFVASSLANGLGAYDAASALFEAVTTWAGPYLLGRVHLGRARGPRRLADGLVTAALLYVPLCAFELRMSPQLHRLVYGYHQHAFVQHVRASGFRPMVFMYHGLMVSLFMAMAALVAFWAWRTGRARRYLGLLGPGWAAALLAVTTVLCKSVGAIGLLLAGAASLELVRRARTVAPLALLLALPPAYCTARLAGWSAEGLVAFVEEHVSAERARSLGDRLRNEDLLAAKALERPALGWSRWGGSHVYDDDGNRVTETDGLWIIALGVGGFSGLVAIGLLLLLPAGAVLARLPRSARAHPARGLVMGLAAALAVAAVDDLVNDMRMPITLAIAGALVTCVRVRAWRAAAHGRAWTAAAAARLAAAGERP